jgi:LCP family protein required for cell wall assembly
MPPYLSLPKENMNDNSQQNPDPMGKTKPRRTPDWMEQTRPMTTQWDPSEANTQPLETFFSNQPAFEDESIAQLQPIKISNTRTPLQKSTPSLPKRKRGCGGCFWLLLIPLLAAFLLFLLYPARTNILVLGIDRAPEGTNASRTDTNIILSVIPLQPVVNMLSIPRDLWVSIPNVGENRINTAHFFAEANQAGSGPAAAMETVRQNFGVSIDYYARIRFDGFVKIIDSMGGVTINLEEAMSGYEAGRVTLNGDQALAFARDRSGSDDFFRMQRGQMVILAAIKQMANPISWPRIPAVLSAVMSSVDTDIPVWQWPRIGLAVVRAVLADSINNQTITREMVTPYTTGEGASVLLPNWEAINPLLMELFGE